MWSIKGQLDVLIRIFSILKEILCFFIAFPLLQSALQRQRGNSRLLTGGGRGYRPSMNRNDSDLSAAGDLCCKSCPIYFSLSPHFLTSLWCQNVKQHFKIPLPPKNTLNFNISPKGLWLQPYNVSQRSRCSAWDLPDVTLRLLSLQLEMQGCLCGKTLQLNWNFAI